MNSLDNILSRGGEATSAAETGKQDTETTQTASTETTETGQTTDQTTETIEGGEPSKDGKQPPIGAIRQAEREKATKRYTEQVADFDKRLADSNAAWERRFTQLLETVKPKAEPQPAPDWYVEPEKAFEHNFAQRAAPEFDRINQVMTHNSRLIASQLHGEELVTAADQAFATAVQNKSLDPADYHRVLNSPNIYDAAVRWHKRVLAQQEIGDDPAAYKERLKTELLAELQQTQGSTETVTNGAGKPPVVMPSNLAAARNVGARSGPAWAGPTPLNDIFNRKRTA